MIVFENSGEIDFRALSQFGINVKESSNPIGFFGTGLKYALAVLMREAHSVTIYSGENSCVIHGAEGEFRSKAFTFVEANINDTNTPLGFTTELGKNWPMWAAYRELACNCMDEGGSIYETSNTPTPEKGRTYLMVQGAEFKAAYDNRGKYILQDEPEVVMPGLEVRNGISTSVFYRGVRVHDSQRSAMYRYNILTGVELTEDRTTKGNPYYLISCALLQCTDEALLLGVLAAKDTYLEHHFDYHGWGYTPSPAFLAAITTLVQDKVANINRSALLVWKDHTAKKLDMAEILLTAIERSKLDKAVAFVERQGYAVSQYPIRTVESLGDGVLAIAEDKTIFITRQLINIGGATKVASCLIEEYLHLKHNFNDCSREMQTYLFEKIVSLMEELDGVAL